MIVTSTGSIEGRSIAEYLGIVAAEASIENRPVAGLAERVRAFRSRDPAPATPLERARERAIVALVDAARELRADAVLGFRLDHARAAGETRPRGVVIAYGTAVALERGR